MKAFRRTLRRTVSFCERVSHAWDLWNRLNYPWMQAWQIAGTWQ